MAKYPKAICVVGEGELAAHDLVEYVNGTRSLQDVRNIAYLENGKTIYTKRERISDLGEYVRPDYSGIDKVIKLGGNVYVENGRACPWGRCTFCSVHQFWGNPKGYWTQRPVENVITDIRQLYGLGARSIIFSDEEFLGNDRENVERIIKFTQLLKKENLKDIGFYCNARVDAISVEDPQLQALIEQELDMLYDIGLRTVFLGVESGSKSQLKRFGKGAPPETAQKAIQILRKHNLQIQSGFIMFDPLVTKQELRENALFIQKSGILPTMVAPLNTMRIYQGTPYERILRNWEKANNETILGEFERSKLEYKVLKFAYPEVRDIYKLCNEYFNSYFECFYQLKQTVRFNSNAAQAGYLSAYYERFKELEIKLLLDLTALNSEDFTKMKGEEILKNSLKERKKLLATLENDIKANNNEKDLSTLLLKARAVTEKMSWEQPYADIAKKTYKVADANPNKKVVADDGTVYEVSKKFDVIKLGTSGQRGRRDEQVGAWVAAAMAQSGYELLGNMEEFKGKDKYIIIGGDPRPNNEMYKEEEARIALANGFKVIFFKGVMPTGIGALMVRFGKDIFDLGENGVIVGVFNNTPSHNPQSDDGIKFNPGGKYQGALISTELSVPLQERANEIINTGTGVKRFAGDFSKDKNFQFVDTAKVIEYTANRMKDFIDVDMIKRAAKEKGFSWSFTTQNGAAGPWAKGIFDAILPGIVDIMKEEPLSDFGGLESGPNTEKYLQLQYLSDEVVKKKQDGGGATDGDGDRLYFVDEHGSRLKFYEACVLLHWYTQNIRKTGGILATCTDGTDMCEKIGPVAERTKIGFKEFQELLKNENISIAFEMGSGGLTAGKALDKKGIGWELDKDGLIAQALFMEMAAWGKMNGLTISQMLENLYKKYGNYYQPDTESIYFPKEITKKKKDEFWGRVMKGLEAQIGTGEIFGRKILRVDRLDGVKIYFEEKQSGAEYWVLIRPSGTGLEGRAYAGVFTPGTMEVTKAFTEELVKARNDFILKLYDKSLKAMQDEGSFLKENQDENVPQIAAVHDEDEASIPAQGEEGTAPQAGWFRAGMTAALLTLTGANAVGEVLSQQAQIQLMADDQISKVTAVAFITTITIIVLIDTIYGNLLHKSKIDVLKARISQYQTLTPIPKSTLHRHLAEKSDIQPEDSWQSLPKFVPGNGMQREISKPDETEGNTVEREIIYKETAKKPHLSEEEQEIVTSLQIDISNRLFPYSREAREVILSALESVPEKKAYGPDSPFWKFLSLFELNEVLPREDARAAYLVLAGKQYINDGYIGLKELVMDYVKDQGIFAGINERDFAAMHDNNSTLYEVTRKSDKFNAVMALEYSNIPQEAKIAFLKAMRIAFISGATPSVFERAYKTLKDSGIDPAGITRPEFEFAYKSLRDPHYEPKNLDELDSAEKISKVLITLELCADNKIYPQSGILNQTPDEVVKYGLEFFGLLPVNRLYETIDDAVLYKQKLLLDLKTLKDKLHINTAREGLEKLKDMKNTRNITAGNGEFEKPALGVVINTAVTEALAAAGIKSAEKLADAICQTIMLNVIFSTVRVPSIKYPATTINGVKVTTYQGNYPAGSMYISPGVYGYASITDAGEIFVSEGFWENFKTDAEHGAMIRHEQNEMDALKGNNKEFNAYKAQHPKITNPIETYHSFVKEKTKTDPSLADELALIENAENLIKAAVLNTQIEITSELTALIPGINLTRKMMPIAELALFIKDNNSFKTTNPLISPKELSEAGYKADIDQARRDGIIINFPIQAQDDKFSVLNGLAGDNTRSLDITARDAFYLALNSGHTQKPQILELGHGAGHAVSDMFILSRAAGYTPEIDTVGLSPFAPSYLLRMKASEIIDWLKQFAAANPKAALPGMREYVGAAANRELNRINFDATPVSHLLGFFVRDDSQMPLKLIFSMQKQGCQIFDVLSKPAVRNQYLGFFEDPRALIHHKYDYIHEDCGPLYYTDENTVNPVFEKIISLLSDNGVFYSSRGMAAAQFPKDFHAPENAIVIAQGNKNSASAGQFITFKKDSALASLMQQYLISHAWRHPNGVYLVSDVRGLLQEITEKYLPAVNAPNLEAKPANAFYYTQKQLMDSVAFAVADKKIMSPYLTSYFRSFLQTVNPQGKPDKTIGYAFAGPDILTAYFETNFKTAYFYDKQKVSKEILDVQLRTWNHRIEVLDLQNYYSNGFYFFSEFEDLTELYIIQQLRLLGVRKEDVRTGYDEKGRPQLTFRLSGDDVERFVIFVNQDMTNIGDELNSEMAGKLDVFIQKATMEVQDKDFRYLNTVQPWVKTGGFMLLNDNSRDSRIGYNFDPVLGRQYTKVNNRSLQDAREELLKHNDLKYGSSMVVYQRNAQEIEVNNSSAKKRRFITGAKITVLALVFTMLSMFTLGVRPGSAQATLPVQPGQAQYAPKIDAQQSKVYEALLGVMKDAQKNGSLPSSFVPRPEYVNSDGSIKPEAFAGFSARNDTDAEMRVIAKYGSLTYDAAGCAYSAYALR